MNPVTTSDLQKAASLTRGAVWARARRAGVKPGFVGRTAVWSAAAQRAILAAGQRGTLKGHFTYPDAAKALGCGTSAVRHRMRAKGIRPRHAHGRAWFSPAMLKALS